LAFYLLALDGKQAVYPLPVSKMGIPGEGGKRNRFQYQTLLSPFPI
jgi:hypothetical protein